MSKVSIIIPNFNKELFIRETLDAIKEQAYHNWECLIVDDGSNDGSVGIINEYVKKDSRFIFIARKDEPKGGSSCRNIGLKRATGEYIMFVDSDDILLADCLQSRVEVMKKNPFLDFAVFTMGVFVFKVGDNSSEWLPKTINPLSDFLMHKLPWQTMQPIWRKAFVESIGGFDIEFERLQDVEFHTRALLFPEVKFECYNADPDCFFRIDEARVNDNGFGFYKRWVSSSVKYYNKFFNLASGLNYENKLIHTIYRTYVQVLLGLRLKKISGEEFQLLEKELFVVFNSFKQLKYKRIYFTIAKMVNLLPFRIKGTNWVIEKFL